MRLPGVNQGISLFLILLMPVLLLSVPAMAADTTEQARQLYQQGESFLYSGDYQKAADAFSRCLEVLPHASGLSPYKDFSAADVWYNLGDAYISLARYETGIMALDKAISLDPSYAEAWQLKAGALRALNRTAEANEAEHQMELAAQKRTSDFDRAAFSKPTTTTPFPVMPLIGSILFAAAVLQSRRPD